MNRILIFSYLLFTLILAGCAANGPKFTEQFNITEDDSNVYIYRPESALNSAVNAGIYIDGNHVGNIRNGSYFKTKLPNGLHTIKVHTESQIVTISDNNEIYLRFVHGWALFWAITIAPQSLEIVDKNIAITELNETRSLEKI